MSRPPVRIVFMGSPDFAVPSLEALCESGRYRPTLVVSQPDRPKGRGRRVVPTPVRARAIELGIPTDVMTRKTYAPVVERIASEKPDVVVVVAFGIIIKRDLLDMPRLGCVNVHASLLPRHRGVSPVQAAIIAGDAATGCTTMRIDEGIDTGGVLLTAETRIAPDDTAGTLSERLSQIGAELLVRTIDGLVDGTVTPRAQSADGATYTHKIKKEDGAIDWTAPAADVERRVRAMTPWPSAYTFHAGRRVIVARAAAVDGPSGEPGCVVSISPLRVACARGALELTSVKPEGGKTMTAQAYAAGHAVELGERFD